MTRVAVIGGGQLARMMAPPATAMGVTLRVLVETPDASAAAAAHEAVVGMPSDVDAIEALLAGQRPDVVTFEHEHIPDAVFAAAERLGVPARPSREALLYARDKIAMRERLGALGLPQPAWQRVESATQLDAFIAAHGGVAVLKTAMGGYDGKGVRIVRAAADAADWLEGAGALLVEERVGYSRELAMQVARRPSGQVAAWPLVESLQRDGVCAEVIAPAPGLTEGLAAQALEIATAVAEGLDVVGMLAVELFELDGVLLVNELAMRPHNSGHWSIEGAVTSQFEQHLRAVLDWPLGDTTALAPVAVMANVLGGSRQALEGAWPQIADGAAKVHLYGKQWRIGRKLGHVTVLGTDVADARSRAAAVAAQIRDGGAA